MQPLAIDRNAAEAQAENGDIGRPFHQLRHGELAEWNGKEKETERENDLPCNLETEYCRDGEHQHGCQRKLGKRSDSSHFTQQPGEPRANQQRQHPMIRTRHQPRERTSRSPDQPKRDRRHQETMSERIASRPDGHHGQCCFAVQANDDQKHQEKSSVRQPPTVGNFSDCNSLILSGHHELIRFHEPALADSRCWSMIDKWASQL